MHLLTGFLCESRVHETVDPDLNENQARVLAPNQTRSDRNRSHGTGLKRNTNTYFRPTCSNLCRATASCASALRLSARHVSTYDK